MLVDAELIGRRRKDEAASVRVHGFATLGSDDSSQALTAELRILLERHNFPRRAWVNLWDVRSSHQYLRLPSARVSDLEFGARSHGASVLGMDAAEVSVSTKIGATRGEPGRTSKTEVSFFAASSRELRQRLRPMLDAGFVVEGVTTPCGALWAQAQLRRPMLPGQVDAHVALGPNQSALGIFSNGMLLYARDLEWGYAATSADPPGRRRDVISRRLAVELRRSFLYLKQFWEDDVSQVLLCGDMPEMRSIVAPLIDHLNIEVEALDTLAGIDTASLPSGFAEQAAAYRLASSIAAHPPPVNLLPVEVTADRTSRTGQRIFAAGSAAAVVIAAILYAQAGVNLAESERQRSLLQLETAQLRPVAQTSQRDGLTALEPEGPAIARLLEAVANATPDDLTIRSVRLTPGTASWRLTVEAFAAGPESSRARAIADRFVRALEATPQLGTPPEVTRRVDTAGGIEMTAIYTVSR